MRLKTILQQEICSARSYEMSTRTVYQIFQSHFEDCTRKEPTCHAFVNYSRLTPIYRCRIRKRFVKVASIRRERYLRMRFLFSSNEEVPKVSVP